MEMEVDGWMLPLGYGKSGRGFEIRCKLPVVKTTVATIFSTPL